MMPRFLALLFFLMMAVAAPARAAITVDVSSDLIRVTTGFNGSSITVFGTQDGVGTLVLMVEGPSRAMTIRKKTQLFGLWTFTDSRRYANLPVYYDMATSGPLADAAPPEVLGNLHIGLTNLLSAPADGIDDGTSAFSSALVRIQQQKGLYGDNPRAITYVSPMLFKAVFDLPALVSAGNYKVSAYLFRDGALADQASVPFVVVHEGLSAELRRFATEYSFLYGLAGVLMALVAGWLATVLLKRE
ncbi:MAG: TIGR02186 family protein [Alphaproteobacteria bacterium]|nr:TIGR02186 family protein [Alphaproteobacteria bacterium]